MPRGLDGNPNPIRTKTRDSVLKLVVQEIMAVDANFKLVGIDGPAGSGKSTFADEVARALESCGVTAIRSTTDSFHNPRSVRYRLGRWSPEGYYRDSHNLDAIRTVLLHPFSIGEGFKIAAFDEAADRPVDAPLTKAPPGSVLLFDGLFVHRPELRHYWHYSVFLSADQRLKLAQLSLIDQDLPTRSAASINRYAKGWDLYLTECNPLDVASLLIDNNDLASPFVMESQR